jgi:DNA-binding PadR family transcriptional regulator
VGGVARTSQTETAVLGALSVEPMTGYALREAIRDVLGHFWSESFGQIYPTLEHLERHGYVERRPSDRSRSSNFTLTGSGRARLRALLAEPIQPAPPRSGLLLRLFFGRQLGPEACRALLCEARDEALQRLQMFAELRREIDHENLYPEDRPYWLLTISAGEHGTHATVDWADEAIEALDALGTVQPGANTK